MKEIEFKATFAEGQEEFVTVKARTINAGMVKALKLFREPLGSGVQRELNRVEFWMVKS